MPNFNFPGEKGGIFCAQHKSDGMVDIKHKRCVEPGCNKRPSFNYTGASSSALPCPAGQWAPRSITGFHTHSLKAAAS